VGECGVSNYRDLWTAQFKPPQTLFKGKWKGWVKGVRTTEE